jgi:hypothetical protein
MAAWNLFYSKFDGMNVSLPGVHCTSGRKCPVKCLMNNRRMSGLRAHPAGRGAGAPARIAVLPPERGGRLLAVAGTAGLFAWEAARLIDLFNNS